MNISPKCAVELLEIIKYMDDTLKEKLPEGFIEYLNSIKDNEYNFEIDKNKIFFDNNFLDETIEVLMNLFST